MFDSGAPRAARQFVNRRVPFPDSDDLLCRKIRQDFTKTPNPALVGGVRRGPPLEPELFQCGRGMPAWTFIAPAGINDFQEIATMLATKTVSKCNLAASDAAQLRDTPARLNCRFGHPCESTRSMQRRTRITEPHGRRPARRQGREVDYHLV